MAHAYTCLNNRCLGQFHGTPRFRTAVVPGGGCLVPQFVHGAGKCARISQRKTCVHPLSSVAGPWAVWSGLAFAASAGLWCVKTTDCDELLAVLRQHGVENLQAIIDLHTYLYFGLLCDVLLPALDQYGKWTLPGARRSYCEVKGFSIALLSSS